MSLTKYGYTWSQEPYPNDVSIELICYRDNLTKRPGSLKKYQYLSNAIKLLWPAKMPSGDKGYVWNYWTDRRVKAWCESTFRRDDEDWQTWWGPSSSGKSTDAGIIALTHWISAPDRTTVIVCSTTKDMLEKRIFGEIVRYHSLYKGHLPGEYSKSKHSITYGDENSKNGIFGIAIQRGTLAEALGNMVGIHNEFNVLIIDEMQSTREAAVDAADNLSTGAEFKFLGMGNPVSRLDALGRYSEPVKGWDSISTEDEEWETTFGKTLYFDGLKSPAIKEPKKYFFLLNQKQINKLAKTKGEDSPSFWSQRRGFVPPEGLLQTVITESFIVKFHIQAAAEWEYGYTIVAGLDPAYASGGDRCILAPARVGKFLSGPIGIEFLEPIIINLKLSQGQPIAYYLAEQVQMHCERLGIQPHDLAVDVSATQGAMADVIEHEWGPGLHRVQFGGSPSELRVSSQNDKKANKEYKNRVTELWFNIAEFARHDQVRGLGLDACKELCTRLVKENVSPIMIEPKGEMKGRTDKSPDIADATVCVTALVRERMGIHPGGFGEGNDASEQEDYDYEEADLDGEEDAYMYSDFA